MKKKKKPQEIEDILDDKVDENPKKKMSKKKIVIIVISAILFVLVVGIIILNIYINSIINLRVKGSHVKETYASSIHDDDNVVNIAIIGRNLLSNKYVHQDSQTNSVKVVSLDFNNKRMVISNIHSYPVAYSPISKDLIAYGQLYVNGGFDEFVGTLNYDLDLNIDRYISISYNVHLFAQCIDILGGVDVELNQDELDYLEMDGKPGVYHLNGELAMKYTDYRYESIDSAEAKMVDRRTIVFNKCLEIMKNASIFKLIELAKAAMPYIETDLSNWEINRLMVRIMLNRLFHSIISIRYPDNFYQDCNIGSVNQPILYDYEGFVKDIQDNIYINKDYKSTKNIKTISKKFDEILTNRLLEGK